MTDDIEQMQDTFERDQDDAAINDITKQVARHFGTLRLGAGMSEAAALVLTRDFQRFLMAGEPDIEYAFGEVE